MAGNSGRLARALGACLVLALIAPGPAVADVDEPRPQPAKSYRSYMAFGDSLTFGTGTSDPASKAYPVQADVRGYGVNGACVVAADCGRGHYNALDWWPTYWDLLDNHPAVAVFEIGINDIAYSPAVDIVRGLQKLRRRGEHRGVEVVFGTLTPSPAGDFHRAGERVRRQVNRWIRAQETFVEYARPLQCAGRTLCPEFVSPTWKDVHLSDEGAAVMAETLLAWIEADRAAGGKS
jgi:lysophospholipase L1-like esterase